MKQLICEMCGSTDLLKQDGVFVCQSCGTKYSVKEAKKMMIEGTVKVQGTVQVDNSEQVVNSLLKRAFMFLEEGDFDHATEYCNRVLDIEPECAKAYMGLFLADKKLKREQQISSFRYDIKKDKNFAKTMQFADDEYLKFLNGYLETINQSIIERNIAYENQQQEEQKKIEENKSDVVVVRNNITKIESFIAANNHYTIGLNIDGTVVNTGENFYGQCTVSKWSDIVAIAAGFSHTVGLKSDGTVVAIGNNEHGQCNVSEWNNIIAIAAGFSHTVGLKSDGTVVAVGKNDYEQCNVSKWSDIVSISARNSHTVGLKSDGTVVAVGRNDCEQCNVFEWTDIVSISAGGFHTVGLKSNGTVVAVGDNKRGQCDVSRWSNIVSVSAGAYYTVGLKSNGTVAAVGDKLNNKCDVSKWRDIVAISAGWDSHTVGLKLDGTVIAIGDNFYKQCDVSKFKLFNNFETIEEEWAAAKKLRIEKEEAKKAEEQRKFNFRQNGVCQYCGGEFKGRFTKKCVACGKIKDYSEEMTNEIKARRGDLKKENKNGGIGCLILALIILGLLIFGIPSCSTSKDDGNNKVRELYEHKVEFNRQRERNRMLEDN